MKLETISAPQRDDAAWLGHVETSAILPLKWFLTAFCIFYWLWARDWRHPGELAFLLFFVHVAITAGEHYFFTFDRVLPSQTRGFVLASFLLDGFFVTALVLLDGFDPPALALPNTISDYNYLYVLLVLRGLALYRTRGENFSAFSFTTVAFLTAASFQLNSVSVDYFLPAVRKLAMIWGVMLITQAFIGLVNQRLEEMLRQRERAVQSASLASIGELTAGVAHEINNPIGVIKTYADYLEQSVSEGDPLRDDFQTIRREADRCEQLVRRMMDFANPRLEGIGAVDVLAQVRETLDFVFHQGRDDKFFETEIRGDTELPRIHGDAVQIRQSLLNVMLNARQMVLDMPDETRPEKGLIIVEVSRALGPRAPVRIRIIDNGPGISPEDARKVFEPFFTRRKKGTGLGLAITRRIIEAHNGSIDIAPYDVGGTVVTIDLPIEGEQRA